MPWEFGLVAVVLGPWAAMLAVSVAIVVQALFFADGGVTAIGANCFNMAIAGALIAYGTYRLIAGRSKITSTRRAVAAGIAGYCAVNVSALLAAVEFGIQPFLYHDASGAPLYCPYPLRVAIPAMMRRGRHLTIAGIAVEAFAPAGVVAFSATFGSGGVGNQTWLRRSWGYRLDLPVFPPRQRPGHRATSAPLGSACRAPGPHAARAY